MDWEGEAASGRGENPSPAFALGAAGGAPLLLAGVLQGVALNLVRGDWSQGRVVTLPSPNPDDLIDRLNEDLAVSHVPCAGPKQGSP